MGMTGEQAYVLAKKLIEAGGGGGGTVDAYTKTQTDNLLMQKVDKEVGKGLFSGSYNDLSDTPTIPSKTSELQNDSGYLTEHQDLTGYAKKDEIPTVPSKVSELTNDSNYQTAEQVNSTVATEIAKIVADAPEDLNTLKEMSDWIAGHEKDASAMNSAISDNKTAITALQTGKADKTDIPTSVSELSNDSGYATETFVSNKLGSTDISAIGDGTVTGAIDTINTSIANDSIPLNVYMAINHYLAIKVNVHDMNYSFNISDRSGNIYEGTFFSYNGSVLVQITKINSSPTQISYIIGFRQYKVSDSEIYLVMKASDYNYINGVINTSKALKSNIEILVNDNSELWDNGTDVTVQSIVTTNAVGGLTLSASGTTLSITDGTNTWTLEANS